MKNFSRLLALLLALCLMGGCALAELPELPASEEAEVESESVAEDTAQEDTVPVSYTHLDVYKRQGPGTPETASRERPPGNTTAPAGHGSPCSTGWPCGCPAPRRR